MTFWNFDKVYFTILVNSEHFWPLQFTSYQKHIDFHWSSLEIFYKFMFFLCFTKIGTVVAVSRIFSKLFFYKNIFFENSKMSCQINCGQKTAKWRLFRFVAFFMKQSLLIIIYLFLISKISHKLPFIFVFFPDSPNPLV